MNRRAASFSAQAAPPTGRSIPSNLSSVVGGSHCTLPMDDTVYGVMVRHEPVS